MYILVTQALVAFDVYLGVGDKNPMVVNRIVATVVGVLMAMFVASMPPFIKGGDPEHAVACWTSMKDDLLDLLRTLVEEDDCSKIVGKDYKASFLQDAMAKRSLAMFYVKDADKFKVLPFGRVDERLKPLIEDMIVSEYLLRGLLFVAGGIAEDGKVSALREGKEGSALKRILSNYSGTVKAKGEEEPREEEPETWSIGEETVNNRRTSLFLSIAGFIDSNLRRQ